MTLQSYADKASRLVGDDMTPAQAVADSVKGKGLNREKISRICTLLNLKLLERDKQSAYKEKRGRLWQSRWKTAKPQEVYDLLGMTMPDVPGRDKKSSAPRGSNLETWQLNDLLPRRNAPGTSTVVKLSEDIGRPDPALERQRQHEVDVLAVDDLQGMVYAAREAEKMAQVKIAGAEMGVDAARAALLEEITQTWKSSDLTLGEVLYAVKHSCPSNTAFVAIVSDVLERESIDPSAALGLTLTPDGDWDRELIKASQEPLRVRPEYITDALTGKIVLSRVSPLVKASTVFGEAVDGLRDMLRVRAILEETHGDWSRKAHAALFNRCDELGR